MESSALYLENKIHRYHDLCKRYERLAGTEKGDKILYQIAQLRMEINAISEKLSEKLDDSFEATHFEEED